MLMTREATIGPNTRVELDLLVQPLDGDANSVVACRGQASFDRENWFDVADLAIRATGAGRTLHVGRVSGERLRFVLDHEGATGAHAAFDLRVRLEQE